MNKELLAQVRELCPGAGLNKYLELVLPNDTDAKVILAVGRLEGVKLVNCRNISVTFIDTKEHPDMVIVEQGVQFEEDKFKIVSDSMLDMLERLKGKVKIRQIGIVGGCHGRTTAAALEAIPKDYGLEAFPKGHTVLSFDFTWINGKAYTKRPVKKGASHAMLSNMYDQFNYVRSLPEGTNIEKEFELIELKQSKLTKWQRDIVTKQFHAKYEPVQLTQQHESILKRQNK